MSLHGAATSPLGQALGQSAAAVSHTGDTTENTVASCTVPANSMGANGTIGVRIDASGLSGTSTKTVRLKLGGTTLWSRVMPASETAIIANVVIANRGATNSQRWSSLQVNSANASIIASGTMAIDTTADQTLAVTIQLANAADTAAIESYQVIVYPKA